MPLSYKSSWCEDSLWCDVAGLTAEDDLRQHDPFVFCHDEFIECGASKAEVFACDLAKVLNNLQNGPFLLEEIDPVACENFDENGNLSSIEFEDELDSDLSTPASGSSSPASPSLPPVDFEFRVETVTGMPWESELFGGALPALVAKAVDLMLEPSSSASSSSDAVSLDLLPLLSDKAEAPGSLKGKRKEAPTKASPRARTKRGKTSPSSETPCQISLIVSAPSAVEAASAASSPSETTPSKRRQSPGKKRSSPQDVFSSQQVVKISSKSSHEEEEDVDID